MPNPQSQAKIMAQGIYEIRLLLSAYLGSQNAGDPAVRRAARLAYALHNEALAVIEGRTFDGAKEMDKIRAVDRMFDESYASHFECHISNDA
jgi:hypothetical protein